MVSEREESARTNGVINVLGWYNRNNIGDESFKVALHHLFPDEIFEFINEKPIEGCPLILGGGDVVKDFYLREISQPFVALGVGLGYPSEIERYARVKDCKLALFRNSEDTRMACKYGFHAQECPDLAFGIEPPQPMLKTVQEKKKMAVILAHSVTNPGMGTSEFAESHYQEYMRWELAKAFDILKEWYEIHFLPMSNERYAYDETAHFEVASRMKTSHTPSVHRWVDADPIRFMSELGSYDLVVSMKYHGLIFATIMGVPFVNIGLSRKTSLYCQEWKMTQRCSVEPYTFTCDRLLECIKNAEGEGVSESLLLKAARYRKRWQELVPEILSAIYE